MEQTTRALPQTAELARILLRRMWMRQETQIHMHMRPPRGLPIELADDATMIGSRRRQPRGLVIELSDDATMIGDLSGVVRAYRPEPKRWHDQRFIETTMFTLDNCGFAAPPPSRNLALSSAAQPTLGRKKSVPPAPTRPRSAAAPTRMNPWQAAALGFFGVLLGSVPMLLRLFAG